MRKISFINIHIQLLVQCVLIKTNKQRDWSLPVAEFKVKVNFIKKILY